MNADKKIKPYLQLLGEYITRAYASGDYIPVSLTTDELIELRAAYHKDKSYLI